VLPHFSLSCPVRTSFPSVPAFKIASFFHVHLIAHFKRLLDEALDIIIFNVNFHYHQHLHHHCHPSNIPQHIPSKYTTYLSIASFLCPPNLNSPAVLNTMATFTAPRASHAFVPHILERQCEPNARHYYYSQSRPLPTPSGPTPTTMPRPVHIQTMPAPALLTPMVYNPKHTGSLVKTKTKDHQRSYSHSHSHSMSLTPEPIKEHKSTTPIHKPRPVHAHKTSLSIAVEHCTRPSSPPFFDSPDSPLSPLHDPFQPPALQRRTTIALPPTTPRTQNTASMSGTNGSCITPLIHHLHAKLVHRTDVCMNTLSEVRNIKVLDADIPGSASLLARLGTSLANVHDVLVRGPLSPSSSSFFSQPSSQSACELELKTLNTHIHDVCDFFAELLLHFDLDCSHTHSARQISTRKVKLSVTKLEEYESRLVKLVIQMEEVAKATGGIMWKSKMSRAGEHERQREREQERDLKRMHGSHGQGTSQRAVGPARRGSTGQGCY
jgi:hypothetical protein